MSKYSGYMAIKELMQLFICVYDNVGHCPVQQLGVLGIPFVSNTSKCVFYENVYKMKHVVLLLTKTNYL